MPSIKELKAKVAKEAKAQDAKLNEELEKINLETQFKGMKSPAYKARRLRELNSEKIENIIESVKEVTGRPVYTELSLGQAGKILGILRTIITDYKNRKVLMNMLDIPESIIEDYRAFVGNPSYFSKDKVIVQSVPMVLDKTIQLVEETAVILGVQVDTSLLSTDVVNRMYAYYADKAAKDAELAAMVVDEVNVDYED